MILCDYILNILVKKKVVFTIKNVRGKEKIELKYLSSAEVSDGFMMYG